MWWMGEVVGKGLEQMSWCARTGERIGSAVNNSPGPTVYDLPRAATLRHTACLFVIILYSAASGHGIRT
jgi:hypothetical protein